MPDSNPTVRFATADAGAVNSTELEAAETNALIALHAFCSHLDPSQLLSSTEQALRVEEFIGAAIRRFFRPRIHK